VPSAIVEGDPFAKERLAPPLHHDLDVDPLSTRQVRAQCVNEEVDLGTEDRGGAHARVDGSDPYPRSPGEEPVALGG
jgi:hypothetical protein